MDKLAERGDLLLWGMVLFGISWLAILFMAAKGFKWIMPIILASIGLLVSFTLIVLAVPIPGFFFYLVIFELAAVVLEIVLFERSRKRAVG